MSEAVVLRHPVSSGLRTANVAAKAGLILMLIMALLFLDASHMRDKAAGLRALFYPMLAFSVPALPGGSSAS